MEKKIERLLLRLDEVEEALGNPEALSDKKAYRALTTEHAYLSDVRHLWDELVSIKQQFSDNEELMKTEVDPDFLEVLREDSQSLEVQLVDTDKKMKNLLIPPDPNDHRNTIMELRAGTGGDEAALFVGDCVRMYKYFAEKKKWKFEELSSTSSERGGYKEFVMVLAGPNVHRFMQFEAGTHRVQRVPETEAQGRVHTSAVTIAVLLEPDEEEAFDLNEKDLRVDTYRASGAGGQHVNTTDSAVRVTHIPTGAVAYCSEEKSQHKNKDKAMRLLHAKIVDETRRKVQEAEAATRSSQVGSGDRSERVRTYNFPQNRLSDHRIGFTRYNLDLVMTGEIDEVVEALVAHYYQKNLES